MVITSKRGERDNVVTNEFICDTTADLNNINPRYITLGSTAIVLKGDNGLEVFMATSSKEWIGLGAIGGNANSGPTSNVVGEGAAGSMIIHDDDASAPTADAE